jgi:hypothetical protein
MLGGWMAWTGASRVEIDKTPRNTVEVLMGVLSGGRLFQQES